MNVIRLGGCTLEPLGSYLKALAVLRLVSEQADGSARGWWSAACFCLETELDENRLVAFFLEGYAPTPILSPWNGGSGFYPKDRTVGIDAITGSTGQRFAVYREAIEGARAIPEVAQEKGASKSEEDKRRADIQLACRNQLPDGCVDWLDAAVGISAKDERTFAPILGTGGNEGRLDYTNNFMESVAELLIAPDSKTPVEALLRNSVFGSATGGLQPSAVGQYDPGRAGGFNQGQGVETADVPSNPWNFVLTLEGAVGWAAGLYRRQGIAFRSFLCSPFTVKSTPVGYGSAAANDGDSARAEIWAPIWERRATYGEMKALLREGRAAVDGRPAQNGLEFAEAACMLGVDRGIAGFMRYNLLKRRGDSYVALPVGRFEVRDRSESDLVRELNGILEAIDWQMKPRPAEFVSLRRQVEEGMYNVLLRGGEDALEDLAASVGRLYRRMLLTGKEVRIPAGLSRGWVGKLSNTSGTAEARIAAALAGIWDQDAPAMVEHLDRANRNFSWTGATVAERMARTLERRVLLAEQGGLSRNPLASSYRAGIGDATLFLEGSVDDERIEELLFAFTLVNWRSDDSAESKGREDVGVWPVYALLKHLFFAEQVETQEGKKHLMADLGVLAALTAGDVEQAVTIGARRLQNAGLLRAEMQDPGGFDGMRLAAALLIPVPYGTGVRDLFKTRQERRND
ncbi:MAG: type I-U CRISPR-associated protein Csx17 [Bryobacteraceae bacterium]|jgi:CRISPR-associated protein Csx17